VVAALDALGELDFLRGREQRHAADVLEEQLEGVGGDVVCFGLEIELGLLGGSLLEHLDVQLLESVVELVDLRGLQLELVEAQRDLFLSQEPRVLTLPDQRLGGVLLQQRQSSHSIPSPLSHQTPLL
jgi:hypothetical protein